MKQKILLDLFAYCVIPLLGWNLLRGHVSDYALVSLCLIPGLLYTVATVVIQKEWSISGMFFLIIIVLNLVVNLLSSTAEEELWNPVWLSGAVTVFYIVTMLLKRPFGMFFFIDYAYAKGIPRAHSRSLYTHPRNIHYFYKFTTFLMLREIASIGIKAALLARYGVEGYNQLNVATSVINYAFTGLMVLYIIYIQRHIDYSVVAPQPATPSTATP